MEVLNGLIRFADQNGYLSQLPSKAAGCRASLYADDLVVFLAPVQGDAEVMKEMLRIFGHASGLFTNMEKSVATPIQCSTEQLQLFVSRFGCQIAHFPCRYLGVPLSVHKLSRSKELPLINSVANRIPAWKENLLNLAGRATLTAVTLSAIPTHTAIAVCLSPWAVQQIDKKRRAFLWSGTDQVAGGKCRVAWTVACRPKDLGGLGLIDLRRFGIALQLRWEWKRRMQAYLPWVPLPSPDNKTLASTFLAATDVVLGDGNTAIFWLDRWLPDGRSVQEVAPHVMARVPRRCRATTIAEAIHDHTWVRHIAPPFSVLILTEYLQLWDVIQRVHFSDNSPDVLRWKWSADMSYSSASAYHLLFAGAIRPLGAKELWKVAAPPKVKHFFWLALHKRCWTAARRHRRGLQQSPTCILCGVDAEEIDHILIGCSFSRSVWQSVLGRLHLSHVPLQPGTCFWSWWLAAWKLVPKEQRKGFDSVVFVVGWILWNERNARTFDSRFSSP